MICQGYNSEPMSLDSTISVVIAILKIKGASQSSVHNSSDNAMAPLWLFDIVDRLDSHVPLMEFSRRSYATLLAGYKSGRFISPSILTPINMTVKELDECIDALYRYVCSNPLL